MADLLQVHNRILFHLNKESGAYVSHEELDDIIDQAQMQEFSFLLGNEREYPNVRIAVDRNFKVHTELLRFKAVTIMGTNPFSMPTNTMYIVGAINTANNSQVKFVDEDELGGILNSEIVSPSETYPILNLEAYSSNQMVLQAYPESVTPNISVSYLRRPVAPQLVYAMSGRQVVYDDVNSVQLEWSDVSIEKIIQRSLGMLGVHFNAQGVSTYYESKQSSGN